MRKLYIAIGFFLLINLVLYLYLNNPNIPIKVAIPLLSKILEKTQDKRLVLINEIIEAIKNPDQALLAKHQVDPQKLAFDQDSIACGIAREEVRRKNLGCRKNTLEGIKKAIERGDYQDALAQMQWENNSIIAGLRGPVDGSDSDRISLSLEEAYQLDPLYKVFPRPVPGRQDFLISEIKKPALERAIQLLYELSKTR